LAKKATKKGLSPKLDMKWQGPFLVIDKLSDVVFRIQRNGPRGLQKVVHFDNLKPYCGKPPKSWLNSKKPVQVEEIQPAMTLKDAHNTIRNSEKPVTNNGHENNNQPPMNSHNKSEETQPIDVGLLRQDNNDDLPSEHMGHPQQDGHHSQQQASPGDVEEHHRDGHSQHQAACSEDVGQNHQKKPCQKKDTPTKPPSMNSRSEQQEVRYPKRQNRTLPQRYR